MGIGGSTGGGGLGAISGTPSASTFLRGDNQWSTPPSILDSALGSSYPWKASDPIGPELWALANFSSSGGGTNTTLLSPTLTANGTTLTSTTAIDLGNLVNADTPFRLSFEVTSMPTNGWASVNIALVSSGGSLIAGTDRQRVINRDSAVNTGRFQIDFLPPSSSPYLQVQLQVFNNSTTGTLTITDVSLRQIAHVTRPMWFGNEYTGGGASYPRVWVPLFDPVAGLWKLAVTDIGADGALTLALAGISGYTTDRPTRYDPPDPTFVAAVLGANDNVASTELLLGASDFTRSMRSGNNDQILEVLNGSSAYELRCNVHGGETNSPAATFAADHGDGSWVAWDGTGKTLRTCRRLQFTFPTVVQLTTGVSPFASVAHVATFFNDGVMRMDRTTTFLADVRLRNHFEWMSSHSTTTPKVGRIGRGLFVLDEVDIYNKLAAPASPSATQSTSGGTLAAGTYGYVVTTLTENGESTPTAMVTATTTGSTSKVTVAWTAVTNATGYRVYGRSSTLGFQTLLATIPAGTVTWDDTNANVPEPGRFAPDVNTARRDTGASNSNDVAEHQGANWAAWYDIPLNMVFANIYDRDAVLARSNIAGVRTRLEMAPSVCKNYLNVFFTGDGVQDNGIATQPITTGTIWSATHWAMTYIPADRRNWHNEAAIRSMDLTKLKELYPAT